MSKGPCGSTASQWSLVASGGGGTGEIKHTPSVGTNAPVFQLSLSTYESPRW